MGFVMNILHSTSSSILLKPISHVSPPLCYYPKIHVGYSLSNGFPLTSRNPSCPLRFSISAANPWNQETVSVVEFEDFVEKDWSFLECDDTNSDGEHMQKIDRIISAGEVNETSKVLVSMGSESFVDRMVESSPCEELIVVHDSLLILACIKERYDKVKCWQGEVINVPEKWTAFDVVFLYFLPALPFQIDEILAALAKRCLPGARIVISHPQGRQVVEEQQQQFPDVVISNLPDKMTIQSRAADHSFQLVEFLDEPGYYLAVLIFNEK